MSLYVPQPLSSIAVVILNWNLADETAACVESFLAGDRLPDQIIVVDNGSEDDSVATLRTRFGDRITLIESGRNLGFAGGNNLGIQRGLSGGSDWVFLANNDTVVASDCLSRLLEVGAAVPALRLLGPLILYHAEPTRIWSLGDRSVGNTLLTRSMLRDAPAPPDLPALLPVDYLTACGLLVHRSVFAKIGLLDEAFFMYAEDADFCRRAHDAGFRLACVTRARMWHKVSRSTGIHHPLARSWRTANQIRFYRRHSHGGERMLLWLFTAARLALMSLRDLLHGRIGLLGPTWRAWAEGWFDGD